jgi:Zn-dependent protease with chaperone function
MADSHVVARCPTCKAELPDTGRFSAWCPACSWNVEVESSWIEWKSGPLDKLIEKVRGRYASRQFEDLVARDPATLHSRWTTGKAAAYGIAAVVNVLPFALLTAGVWLIVSNFPQLGALVWGGVLLLGAWVFRPRINRMPETLLPRETAPRLYAFVDSVAAANGAPKVHALVLNAEFNATFQKAGYLYRPIVTIGLPLWSVLEPQERVALLSHEFAHGMNGDSLAHGFIGDAIGTLAGLSATFAPDPQDIYSALFSPLLVPVSGFFRWLAILMILLLWQRSQEAEFLADYAASRVGGSEAAQSMLQKLPLGGYLRQVLEPISFSMDWQKHNFFPAFKTFVANLPPLELERMRRLTERGDFSKETTHPPDWARARFLERHPSEPAYRADASEVTAIDAELSRFEPRLTGSLLNTYFPHH